MAITMYNSIILMLKFLTSIFFREVEIIGLENVPEEGPILLVGNHQNQFVDPVMLLTSCPRVARFLIAEKSMHRALIGFFARLLKSIPVVRPQDHAMKGTGTISATAHEQDIIGVDTEFGQQVNVGDKIWVVGVSTDVDELPKVVEVVSPTHVRVHPAVKSTFSGNPFKIHAHVDQSEVFGKVTDALLQDSCVGIFPEGGSHDRSELLPLKAGVAIMALTTMEKIKQQNGSQRVAVVPCGLNYFAGHRFRSHVLVEYGKPIFVTDELVERYEKDKRGACNDLLKMVEQGLKGVTLNAPDLQTLHATILGRRIYQPENVAIPPDQYLQLNRAFLRGYVEFRTRPEVQHLMTSLADYQKKLAYWGMHDSQVRTLPPLPVADRLSLLIGRIVMLVVLIGFAFPAFIVNFPAAILARRLAHHHAKIALANSNVKIDGRDVLASYKVIFAIVFVPFLYFLYACVVGYYYGVGWAMGFFFVLTPMYSYAGVLLGEVGHQLWMSTFPLMLSLVPGGESYHKELQRMRKEIKKEVRQVVDQLGPDDSGRIIKKEDIEKDTPAEPSLRRPRSYAPAHK